MNRKLALCLVAGMFVALGLAAQTADELIEKNIQARGGREKLKTVQTIRYTGKMSIPAQGIELPFTQEQSRPSQLRRDFTLQGMTGSQAYDGKTAWQIMPFMGKKDPEPMTGDELKELTDEADVDGPLVDYKEKGNTVEYLGKADVEGSPTYKLKLTQKSGSVTTLYLDAETYLEIKEESKRSMRGQDVEIEESIGNYKKLDEGLTFPYTMEQKMKGQTGASQTLTFEKIEINPKLDNARFAMPAVAKDPAPKPN
jgi:outer membrane lipoprotein-sorting protein